MPAFVILIVISLAFYVYYKIKYVRSSRPVEKKWLSAKSSIALGIFVGIFGINQVFLYQTTLTYVIAAIFFVIGGLSIWSGIKAYRYYLPYAVEEAENLGKHN